MALPAVSPASPTCFGCAASSTLFRLERLESASSRRAAMQLNLELFDQNDGPQTASAAWEQIDEAARLAATEALARLIARMLQDQAPTEASDE
jgi:hypothetical protein